MNLIYGSICSGIESASVAWEPLGMRPAWFSEIEKFPSAVLAHHYPDVTNLGDMCALPDMVADGSIVAPDVLVGGTPCQAFSVAGKRQGLSDERGSLTLKFVELANEIDKQRIKQGKEPCVVVWENVPGVLSSRDNAFGCFLAALAGEDSELQPPGKRWENAGCVFGPQRTIAWRILDAQYFGVAQRRRRVFVVSSAREGFDPAAVLFEREGVLRNPPPSRETRAGPTGTVTTRAGSPDRLGQYDSLVAYGGGNCSGSINTSTAHGNRQDFDSETFVTGPLCHNSKAAGSATSQDAESGLLVPTVIPLHNKATRHAGKRGNKQDGAGNGLCIGKEADPMYTLTSGDKHAVAIQSVADTLTSHWHNSNGAVAGNNAGMINPVISNMAVRRLTPIECERLQGFKDNYTLIPTAKARKIEADYFEYLRQSDPSLTEEQARRMAADGPRYKALGNSKAVPVVRWIGKRLINELKPKESRIVIRDEPEKYELIYADPPWAHSDPASSGKRGAVHKYNVMRLDDICALPVRKIAAENCLLAMWWVGPMPIEALTVVRAWGFELKNMNGFTWGKLTKNDKRHFGMGNLTRGNAESCLFAVRGKPKRASAAVSQFIDAKVGRHSEKPADTRDRLVKLMGDVPRVELFARERADGWSSFGDQVEGSIKL